MGETSWTSRCASLRPYLIAPEVFARALPDTILLAERDETHWVDPLRPSAVPLVDAVMALESAAFSEERAIPRWAMFDCAAAPGIISGYLGPDRKTPLSMLMALPTVTPGHWVVHTLSAAASPGLPASTADIAVTTIAAAAQLLRADRFTATPPWDSPTLAHHLSFAPAELLAAYCPATDEARTAVLRYSVRPTDITRGLSGPPPAERPRTSAGKTQDLIALQRRIEAGERLCLDHSGQIKAPPPQRSDEARP